MQCPSCNHENRTGAHFCGQCGVFLAAPCTACGAANDPDQNFCGSCGARLEAVTPAAAPRSLPADAAQPAGERRQLTVLFCDLVGSTSLSQQLDAEEWRDLLAQYQQAAAAVVERFGGHVAKNLGDGLLIYFGWPTAREGDPERAVRAGLAIVDALTALNATLEEGRRLAVRIGLHTGPVVIADGGEIFGETANIASRVQEAAEPGAVLITAATQRLVPGLFVVEDHGPQLLKGIREPLTLYRVVDPSGVRSRLDVTAGRLTRFVGRQVELATLFERWERVADGEGQNVLLIGEAGVGKSRLAYELRQRLASIPHTWLECSATPYTESTPFRPAVELLAHGLTFTTTDSVPAKIRKIERGLRSLASAEHVALVAEFLGLPPPTPLVLSPELKRRKMLELLAQWVLTMSAVQPVVLLVEDLHWCDASSLEVLGRIIAQSATSRVLLVATARPEFVAPWPARLNLTTLPLARLTKRQAREMATALLPDALPAETVEALVARADGVPLFVEELTKALAEPGATRDADAIPTTLAGSLMARLDRLSTAKKVAQRAAVLGREFGYPLLAAVADMDEAGLREGIARLIDAEILFQRGEPPDATYTFKHALVQEAAYESLLKRTQRQFHARVVDVLREQFPERTENEPEVVARHAEAAGRSDDAVAFYGRAGERAQARSAHPEAVAHFRKAIGLLETAAASPSNDAREGSLQLELGSSLTVVRGYAHPDTVAAYERAVEVTAASDDPTWLGIARTGLALCYQTRGEVERGGALAAQVLAAAAARGDRQQMLLGHVYVMVPEYYQGKFASSLAHCERASALYDPALDHRQMRMLATDPGVGALSFAASNLGYLGRLDTARARARKSSALARRLADPFSLAFALFFEMNSHIFRRDHAVVRERAAELIALSDEHGFPFWLGLGRAFDSAARVHEGDAAALGGVADGLALAAGTGSQAGAPGLYLVVAEAQYSAGRLDDGLSSVAAGLEVSARTGQPFNDANLHRLHGDLLVASGGDRADAVASYQRALGIARELGARVQELLAATSLARLCRDQGKRVEARTILSPIYGSFTEGLEAPVLQDAKALLDELS